MSYSRAQTRARLRYEIHNDHSALLHAVIEEASLIYVYYADACHLPLYRRGSAWTGWLVESTQEPLAVSQLITRVMSERDLTAIPVAAAGCKASRGVDDNKRDHATCSELRIPTWF